ncbi:MAG: ribonuclease E/G, partial [Burkholderiaceae bacterium]|nr:ribonuclease E/G [Burkholderiaceae bacterium]
RSAPELQWDLNYLLKLWAAIDGAAKGGKGAFLIYQESSLVIRAIRDYFNNDIGDILIDTDDVFDQAQQFMAHVMPEHADRVKRYRDDAPLFSRFQIEHQIESAYARTVQLPSGGAIVIDHTEALVSVDVNSARAIKGGDIEETATRTNLEAADEVARQMRLRDLGGLIVIDFIDMEESRNRRDVENRLRDALRQDRARVQFGTISKFGLMEMSRQRLRPALSEGASIPCPRCGGSGHIRDTESSALQILRIIQEESMKDSTASVLCQVPVDVASFLLNEKRNEIAKIELKQRINVLMVPNKTLETPNYRLERLKHDDPRLDNIEASYKMADDIEDPTTVTRRSQERSNKQEPVIKGVLPDMPAPVAPMPAPVAQAEVPAATARPVLATPVAVPASGGFFGWIKSLFGSDSAPAATPAPADARKDEPRRDGRGGRDGERRDGRRTEGRGGERGGRGRRGEGRGGEGRGGERGEARTEQRSDARGPERAEGQSRGGRGSRDRRDGEGRAAATVDGAVINDGAAIAQERSPSAERPAGEQRAPRGEGRGERRERGEGRRERGERGERRGERGPRSDESGNGAAAAVQGDLLAPADTPNAQGFAPAGGNAPELAPADVAPVSVGNASEPRTDRPEGEERRDRRSRDRYGRDRRERGERPERGERSDAVPEQAQSLAPSRDGQADEEAPRPSYFDAFRSPATPQEEAPGSVQPAAAEGSWTAAEWVAPPVVPQTSALPPAPEAVSRRPAATFEAPSAAAPVAAQPSAVSAQAGTAAAGNASTARSLPKVQAFELPLGELAQVAEKSGLQWVNSDAAKIAAVQAAIAAEPKPVTTPRERPQAARLEDGPLVLVETRRDLAEMTLPF